MLPTESSTSIFDIALTLVPEIGVKTARSLLQQFGSAEAIFNATPIELKKTMGVGEIKAKMFKDKTVFQQAEKELQFVEKHQIELLPIHSPNYPKRLRQCDDAPILLNYKGNTNLNAEKVIAVVGTRKNTDYGHRIIDHLLEDLKGMPETLIISGLAAGIDTLAHKAALKNQLPTVGVLGHGLDIIYPFTNRALAKEMLQQGGLLSEYPSGTKPDRQNFPVRNRIVAGMSDVTIVIESDIKGGAMITAYMALSYNRDVAAFPGRVFDAKSDGPNQLIKKNMAACITSASDLLALMNWEREPQPTARQQRLFEEVSEEEKEVLQLLEAQEKLHADTLQNHLQMKPSTLAALLLQLEMKGFIKTLPGKYYRLQ